MSMRANTISHWFDDGTENMFAQKVAVALEETLASCPSTKIILVPSLDDPIGSSV